uniref:Mitochondria-eating protein n=1 Tax=Macrostomum lignano TaxID=282301 RepID=A0A1I8JRL6_9PLAT
ALNSPLPVDLAGSARREASDALRRCYDDEENNERIIRADSSDEAVQDFINCHHQPEDLQGMTEDVIRALTRDNRLYLPPGISYDVIGPFIRAACQLAWEDGHPGAAARIGLVSRWRSIRREEVSYKILSKGTAARTIPSSLRPLVAHYTWPALVQGSEVVARGEACTRRGAATQVCTDILITLVTMATRQVKPASSIAGSVAFDSYSSLALLLLLWRPEHTVLQQCPQSDYELGVRWNVDLLALKRRLMQS